MNDPILPMMLLTAAAGGMLVFILPKQAGTAVGWTAFLLSLVPTLLGVVLLNNFNYSQGALWQGAYFSPWMPQFGIHFSLGVDAISLWLLMLTLVITPLCILDAVGRIQQRQNEFFGWMLLLYAGMIGVFTAHDVLLFYLFFEFTLIPTFFILGIWGHAERRRAAAKFFLYAFTGSVLLLASLIYLAYVHYQQFGSLSFALDDLYSAGQSLSPWQQALVFWGLLIGFAIKVPLFPVHTWMPLALTESPTPGAVMIAAFKLGAYGLIRFAFPMLPAAAVHYTPLLAVLCIISILFGGLVAWVQRDMKKLIAYSIVSHLGLCVLAFLALTAIGVTGGVLVMINQGILASGLLLVMGMIYQRYRTRDLHEVSGLARRLPALGFFAVFFAVGTAAVPGLNGFVSEVLSLAGVYVSGQGKYGGHLGPVYAVIAALGMIVGALYMIYWVACVIFGPLAEPKEAPAYDASAPLPPEPADLNFREWMILSPLAALVLVLGIFPGPVIDSMQPAVDEIRNQVIAATTPAPEQAPATIMVHTTHTAAASDKLAILIH
ncbi:MAG TPA: NADH-quinone oxidoreductase subunit M [Phycisphaerae bacterium]|nr:NADH-quinone oxidoreductase subunit M [Phycisphaerae bacterium]